MNVARGEHPSTHRAYSTVVQSEMSRIDIERANWYYYCKLFANHTVADPIGWEYTDYYSERHHQISAKNVIFCQHVRCARGSRPQARAFFPFFSSLISLFLQFRAGPFIWLLVFYSCHLCWCIIVNACEMLELASNIQPKWLLRRTKNTSINYYQNPKTTESKSKRNMHLVCTTPTIIIQHRKQFEHTKRITNTHTRSSEQT